MSRAEKPLVFAPDIKGIAGAAECLCILGFTPNGMSNPKGSVFGLSHDQTSSTDCFSMVSLSTFNGVSAEL